MAINRLLKTREEVVKIQEEKAKLLQQIELKGSELRELSALVDVTKKRSGFSPSQYKKIEKEHFDRMEALESLLMKKREEDEALTEKIKNESAKYSQLVTVCKSLTEQVRAMGESHRNASEKLGTVMEALRTAEMGMEDTRLKRHREAVNLAEKIQNATNELRTVKIETERRKNEIIEEEKLLAIKRMDLEIYELRLRKKYPGERIIL